MISVLCLNVQIRIRSRVLLVQLLPGRSVVSTFAHGILRESVVVIMALKIFFYVIDKAASLFSFSYFYSFASYEILNR